MGRRGLRRLLSVAGFLAALWVLAPVEPADPRVGYDPAVLGSDLDLALTAEESAFADLRPGTVKHIVWAGEAAVKTPVALVYLHGFSASAEEIRPVPDRVAAALGANLFYTRLSGHGEDGAALARATATDWLRDLAEAVAIGRRLGDRVVLIGTSTGGTLAAIAAAEPRWRDQIAGVVLISPNFGPRNPAAALLDWPWARLWGPVVAGPTRSFTPQNPRHAAFWTTSYPLGALFPMAALVRLARSEDYARARVPALFLFTEADRVVDPARTRRVAAAWGGPVRVVEPVLGAGDDPDSHVIAGDILSPGRTAATAEEIAGWIRALP